MRCLAVVGALVGCAGEVATEGGEVVEEVAPGPAPASLSRFSVPLEYDITAVQRIVEEVVPRSFGSMQELKQVPGDPRRHYMFEATRGPFTAFAEGGLLHLRATLAYSARGYIKPRFGPTISAGCGGDEVRPRVTVELATPLALDDRWHLVSRARVVKLVPASGTPRDQCDVSVFNYNVTQQVVDAARAGIAGQLPSIDRKIGSVDLSEQVAGWWRLLEKPIALTDGVWLLLGPERLSVGAVSGERRSITVPVSLAAHPRIVTSRTEPVVAPGALPPLGRDSTPGGYHIALDGIIDYETASRAITEALSGRSFTQAGRTATLTKATVRPLARGRLALTLAVGGDVDATVELTGTPRIDGAKGEIAVPDLDFDLQTSSKILQTYSWIKSDELRDELRRRARLPMAPVLARGRALLLQGLNRKIGDAVTLTGTVDAVAARALFVTRDGLVVRAEATGNAGMSVKQQ